MKITCDAKELSTIVTALATVAPSKSPRPVLCDVYIHATTDGAVLSATDLEVRANRKLVACDVEASGEACIPAARAKAVMKNVPEGKVTLEATPTGARLVYGKNSVALLAASQPRDWPTDVLGQPGVVIATVPAKALLDGIRWSAIPGLQHAERLYSHKTLFAFGPGGLTLYGAASSLASKALVSHDVYAKGEYLLTHQALNAVTTLLSEDGDVVIATAENAIRFTQGPVSVTTLQADGAAKFPPIDNVIPKFEDFAAVDRQEFLTAAKQAALVLSKESVGIDLSLKKNGLLIGGADTAIGTAALEVEAAWDGEEHEARLAQDFIAATLAAAASEAVGVVISTFREPVVVLDGEDRIMLIMGIEKAPKEVA